VSFQKSTAALIASMILGPPSVALGWAAARHLGKQWRYKASVESGPRAYPDQPYHWLRQPICASMMDMLVATLAAWTWWPMAIGSVIAFLAGTESSRPRRGTRARRALPGFVRRLPFAHGGLHSVYPLIALRNPSLNPEWLACFHGDRGGSRACAIHLSIRSSSKTESFKELMQF
jgi:hypothetical protein